jgi:hypothetical protein
MGCEVVGGGGGVEVPGCGTTSISNAQSCFLYVLVIMKDSCIDGYIIMTSSSVALREVESSVVLRRFSVNKNEYLYSQLIYSYYLSYLSMI